MKIGDQVIPLQRKTTIKPPWDVDPWTVTEVKAEGVTPEGTVRGQAETESKEISKDYQAASDGQARERQ